MIDIRDEKYKKITSIDIATLKGLYQKTSQSKYLPSYHLYPKHGLLNDPNGLYQRDGWHHIFYQWHPQEPRHGLKYWYHLKTRDFISYVDLGIGIAPVREDDYYGAYSGSAHLDGDKVYIYYTGNSINPDHTRKATQIKAEMDGDIVTNFKSIVENEFYTEHFRDPKIFVQAGINYMVIGAQKKADKLGSLAIYREENTSDNFVHLGEIDLGYKTSAYMFECPDFFELNGKIIALFSPQEEINNDKGHFQNRDNVVYIMGNSFNQNTLKLENPQRAIEFDKGFDFYAPQTYIDEGGRRILIAWAGDAKTIYPTNEDSWSELLSMPRELKIIDGILYQLPLDEFKALEKNTISIDEILTHNLNTFKMTFDAQDDFKLELTSSSGKSIEFAREGKFYRFSRFNQDITYKYQDVDKTNRFAPILAKRGEITIYMDNSIIEIFINNNQQTMTSRIFLEDYVTFSVEGIKDYQIIELDSIKLEYKKYDD